MGLTSFDGITYPGRIEEMGGQGTNSSFRAFLTLVKASHRRQAKYDGIPASRNTDRGAGCTIRDFRLTV